MKTKLKPTELFELKNMYGLIKVMKFSPELIAKFEKTSINKLKYQHKVAAELIREFYSEMKVIREKNKAITISTKRLTSQEPRVRCYRCEGDNTRKCGLFLHNEEILNYPKDFIPSRFKQRYECKDCEYPENKFYYLTHLMDNSIGLYFYPGFKKACYEFEKMRDIYKEIGSVEVLIKNHTASALIPTEEVDFVRPMLEKRNNKKVKYLTKKIDRLAIEILAQEKMLVELKSKHQVAVQALENLQSHEIITVEDVLPIDNDTDPNNELVSNNI